jgi:hypothetical protein
MCATGHHCWVGAVLVGLAWWLVASGLLTLTWNKVVCAFAKTKQARYWQALLLVATVCVLCLPRHYMQRRQMMHCGWGHGCCHHHCGDEHKGKCPYGDSDGDGDDDDSKAPDTKAGNLKK